MKVLVKYGLDEAARIDLLADSSILPTGRPLFIPDWATGFSATLGIAIRVCRLGKCIAPRFAGRYWDAFTGCLLTQGVDSTGHIIGHDALSRAHDGALLLGQMVSRKELTDTNGCLQWSNGLSACGEMPLHSVTPLAEATLSHISQYMTLKMGDILCLSGNVTAHLATGNTTYISLSDHVLLQTKVK